jgi:hypothetical protein
LTWDGTWQALEPLYTEGEAVTPYEWAGAHKDEYDPEANNAWGDLKMAVSAPSIHTHSCLRVHARGGGGLHHHHLS